MYAYSVTANLKLRTTNGRQTFDVFFVSVGVCTKEGKNVGTSASD